jgi:hypothetical protein
MPGEQNSAHGLDRPLSAKPSPERVGGLSWTKRTGGRLTRRERIGLLGSLVTSQRDYIAHRLRRAQPSAAPSAANHEIRPPDSRLAREAEAAAAEQDPLVAGHGYRTWIFGRALAGVDGVAVDEELLYAGCLLHDHGLDPVVPGEDFTLRSARRAGECARAAGVDSARTDALADGITVHITPGVSVERDGPLGCYIQHGAMVDIVGNRIWDLPAELVGDALARHSRRGFTRGLAAYFTAEAKAVPGGRLSMLRRCGFIPLMHLAPFDQK